MATLAVGFTPSIFSFVAYRSLPSAELGLFTESVAFKVVNDPNFVIVFQKLGCDRPINYKKENLNKVLKSEYPVGISSGF